MRIAYVITSSSDIGGAQVHVRDLAQAMMERGYAVRVLVGGEGAFTEQLERKGIPYRSLRSLVRPIRPGWDVRAVWELRRALAGWKPDLVSTHSSKAGLIGRLAARSLGIPTVFTAHGWAFTEGVPGRERRLYRAAERMAAPLADKIITVSEYDRRLALRYRIGSPRKVVAIHNGMPDVPVRLHGAPGEGDGDADADVDAPVNLMMVARFGAQKDHSTLLRALAGLKHLSWRQHFIGDGESRPEVRAAAERLQLFERAFFWGGRADVAERLAGAQAFLLISNWEGFPRSILEAMRAGLPVIASDVGGVGEAVIDGETGFLIPRRDADALRDRLERIITDPELRRRMGAAGRKRYESHFTFDHMMEKTLEVYREVSGRPAE